MLCIVFWDSRALANCVLSQPKITELSVHKSYLPVYDGSGTKKAGCIIESKGEIVGYTPYRYLCNLLPDETIEVKLYYGCCDTGPDFGDLVCTARVNRHLGLSTVRADGVGIMPVNPDPRAIDDLIDALDSEDIFAAYTASSKLLEYLSDKTYIAHVVSNQERLKNIESNTKLHANQRAGAARVLLNMPAGTDRDKVDYIVTIIKSEPIMEDEALPTIVAAADYPEYIDQLTPVLIDHLKRQQYHNTIPEAIFTTLEAWPPELLKPFIKQLLSFELDWSDRGKHYDFDNRTAYYQRMNRLVCSISADDTNHLQRDGLYYSSKPERSDRWFSCPPKL